MPETKKKNKSTIQIKTREPKKKGIFDNLTRDKRNGDHPITDILTFPVEVESPNPTHVTQPNPDYQPNPTQTTSPTQPTQPIKDYVKVPNSIVRNAIPNKLFKGMSKQTYDVLYQKSRGAIVPVRKIQITKSELMDLTGFSDNTLSKHLTSLKQVGLIKVTLNLGKHEGSFYEVLIPEEILKKTPNQPNADNPPQNLLPNPHQNQGRVGTVQTTENKEDTGDSKTFLKHIDTIDDDEKLILHDFIVEFRNASIKLTGQSLKISERKKWKDIAGLLVMELELAAARTESISSVPAFLKEVLRRKLEMKTTQPKRTTQKGISKSLQIGKPAAEKTADSGEWETEFLSDEEKQKTLQIMRERIKEGHRELVMSMEPTYTAEDWEWLMNNLEQGS